MQVKRATWDNFLNLLDYLHIYWPNINKLLINLTCKNHALLRARLRTVCEIRGIDSEYVLNERPSLPPMELLFLFGGKSKTALTSFS